MHKRTKALQPTKAVKDRVWERDDHCCVYCGSPEANPEAHLVPRSAGGLGIEENILTLCRKCHREFDEGPKRQKMKRFFVAYLSTYYPDWDEKKLVYRKE
jgi:5-methylcytosine-specific restriction endonuclease McrA